MSRGGNDAGAGTDDVPGAEPPGALAGPPSGPSVRPGGATAEERLQHALKLAYRHLAKRDRTVAEVQKHLEKREVDPASVREALAELVELEYLNDERYAQRYVEDRRRLDGWGPVRITQGLRRTGIAAAVAEHALTEDPYATDEVGGATEVLSHRLAGRPPDGDRGRQKALRMLATKGYPLEVAYAAVRRYEQACTDPEAR